MKFYLLFSITCVWLSAPVAAQTPTGAEIYHDYCSVCHGDEGDGDSRAQQGMVPPPRDFTDAAYSRALTRERMIQSVAEGRPGTAMTGWKMRLSDKQVASVVDYVRLRFMGEEVAGATLYHDYCSVCHGDDGSGSAWAARNLDPAPRNLAASEFSRSRMIGAVTHGIPATAMQGFATQLTAPQIESIVDYVARTLMGRDALSAPPEDYMAAAFDNGIAGDADRGSALYAVNCVACHGVAGQGDGPRAYFIFPKPRNLTSEAARSAYNRPTLFQGIKHGVQGKEMPAWGTVLSDQDVADIAEFVYRRFVNAEPAERG